jgi:signal transduction histidine kinase
MINHLKQPFSFLITIYVLIIGNTAFAANTTISYTTNRNLETLYNKAQINELHDSIKIKTYLEIADLLTFESNNAYLDKTAENYFQLAFELASKTNSLKQFLIEIDTKGVSHRNTANYTMALAWHEKELKLADSLGYISEKIVALNNLGVVHRRIDDYKQGSDFHLKALKLAEETNNLNGISIATNGLGNIQYLLDNNDEAMRLFQECLRIEQSNNHLLGVAINLNNIGNVYKKMGDLDKALEYYMLSLEVNRQIGSQKGVAICYNDIGAVYRARNDFDKALNYSLLGLELNESMNDLNYLANSKIRVAQLYIDKKEYQNALRYLDEALKISIQSQSKANIKDVYNLMYVVYKELKRPELALNYLEKAGQLNDSIINGETRKSIFHMQTLFDRERSENQITLLKKQREISELSSKRQKFISVITGIILLGVLAAFVVVMYIIRMKSQANRLLKIKHQEIEQARAELEVYAHQMELAKEEAIRSNMLKSQFLANMSHEIRTPMNSVIGFTDILAMIITDSRQLSYLESIRSSGKNLLMLINDILDLSKIEAGKMVVDSGPTNIRALFSEIRNIFSVQIMEKNVRFATQIEENVPELISLSEIRLRQILFNLVGNAMKFTKNGEVNLIAYIEKSESEHSFNLFLKVNDTGIGIPAASLDRIFEAFYQETDNPASNHGTGLGLTITKRLIEAMDGSIRVESEFGKGTSFQINFNNVSDETPENTMLPVNNTSGKNEHLVFFLLLTQEQTEDELVGLLKSFNIQIHSFYQINKLMNLLENTTPDCIFIELEGLNEDNYIQVLNKKISKSTRIILIGTANNLDLQPYFTRFQRFIIPDMSRALLKFVRSIAVVRAQELEFETANQPSINEDTRASVVQLLYACKNAQNTQFMNDTDAFADMVLNFARVTNNKALNEYGTDLKNYVSAFDIEKINIEMNEFDQLLSQQGFLE